MMTDEAGNLREFRQKEQQALTTYGWTDQASQIVRLPDQLRIQPQKKVQPRVRLRLVHPPLREQTPDARARRRRASWKAWIAY
jgi:hypothetical protein